MRRILIASLLLSPVLFTASAVASQPATDAAPSTQVRRVSTGIIAPRLLKSTNVDIPADAFDAMLPPDAEVGLKVNIDEQGNARDIQVIKPVNADLDARVVAAVSKFRFAPATLDNQAISDTIDLNIVVKH